MFVSSRLCLLKVRSFPGCVPSGLNLFRVMSLPGCGSSGLCLSGLCPFRVKSLPGYVSSRLWVFRVMGIPGCGFPGCGFSGLWVSGLCPSTDIEGEKAILEVLEYISCIEDKMVPKCYVEFLYEVTKNTPVVGLIQSQSRISLASIKSFLDKQVDIYEDKDILDHIHDEVPVIVSTMTSIKEYEGTVFLPDAVVSLLNPNPRNVSE